MICYVLAIEKQNLGPHVVVGYGIKIFRPGLFITSPDHLVLTTISERHLNDKRRVRSASPHQYENTFKLTTNHVFVKTFNIYKSL